MALLLCFGTLVFTGAALWTLFQVLDSLCADWND